MVLTLNGNMLRTHEGKVVFLEYFFFRLVTVLDLNNSLNRSNNKDNRTLILELPSNITTMIWNDFVFIFIILGIP